MSILPDVYVREAMARLADSSGDSPRLTKRVTRLTRLPVVPAAVRVRHSLHASQATI